MEQYLASIFIYIIKIIAVIAMDQWLRNWVFSMEVRGLNAGKFCNIDQAPFYPR